MELLAAFVAAEPRALDPDFVKAGWLGLAVVLGLCVGIVVLGRSMGKHTRRAGRPWEGEEDAAESPAEPSAPQEDPEGSQKTPTASRTTPSDPTS